MKRTALLTLLGLFAHGANAIPIVGPVELRSPNIAGEVTSIVAPNLIQMKAIQDGYEVVYWVEPAYLDYGDTRDIACGSKQWISWKWLRPIFPGKPPTQEDYLADDVKARCDALRFLDGKDVYIEVVNWSGTKYESNTVVTGNIYFMDYGSYKHPPAAHYLQSHLIKTGVYKVDIKSTRDYVLVAQSKAPDCQLFKGAKGLDKYRYSNLTCKRIP